MTTFGMFVCVFAGESHFKLDHTREAEQWYRAALKVKPDHAPAHLTMGKLLQHKVTTQQLTTICSPRT